MKFEITLHDKPTECSFGINATELFCELKGVELSAITGLIHKHMSMVDIRDLVFCGIQAACLENGTECKMTKFQVGSGLDNLDGDELMDVLLKFTESLPKWAKDDGKKKVGKAKQGGKRKPQRGKA